MYSLVLSLDVVTSALYIMHLDWQLMLRGQSSLFLQLQFCWGSGGVLRVDRICLLWRDINCTL